MADGELKDVDISKDKVEATFQNFGKTVKHVFLLNDVDGAKWFLDSVDKNLDLRLKIKDPKPIETAIKTIAKAHEGQALKPESGWEYNPRYHDLYKFNREAMMRKDRDTVTKTARWYSDDKRVVNAAALVGVDLKKDSLKSMFIKGIETHKDRLESH